MNLPKPRIILCLNTKERGSLSLDKNRKQIFDNPNVGIILVPLKDNSSQSAYYPGDALVNQLQQYDLIQAGNILIKSPFDDSYNLANEASETFAYQKHFIFTTLCGYLGATEVLIEELEVSNRSKKHHLKTQLGLEDKASLVSVSGETNVDRIQVERIESKFALRTNFKGGNPNFPKVEQLINEKQLTNEQNLKFLIGLRQAENLAERQELNLDLSRESSRNFDILGKLLVGIPKLLALKGTMEYKSSIEDMTKYSFRYKITF